MKIKKMVKKFKEAYDKGFVTDLSTGECNSNCDECPASKACNFLADGSFGRFKVNYDRDILPHVKDYTK